MKTLFHFRGQEISFEIFANTHEEAIRELSRIMGDTNNLIVKLVFVSQNHSCPKCSCNATECNYN